MTEFVTLNECPPGLFQTESGTYGFKSEYSTETKEGVKCDAYCLESGEYFAGGVKTIAQRGAILVRPIDPFADAIKTRAEINKLTNAATEQTAAMDRMRKKLETAEEEKRAYRTERDFFERRATQAERDLDTARSSASELRGRLKEARANQLVRRGDIATDRLPDPYDDGIPF